MVPAGGEGVGECYTLAERYGERIRCFTLTPINAIECLIESLDQLERVDRENKLTAYFAQYHPSRWAN